MEPSWTLHELVAEVAARLSALPPPRNGQVRAIPDVRTIRYYATVGLLDRPAAMRGRTALYGPRHVAQVVAIKRLQSQGRSLSEIQTLWPTLDDRTLARMSGVAVPGQAARAARPSRPGFWKQAPAEPPANAPEPDAARAAVAAAAAADAAPSVELRIELAPDVVLSLTVSDGEIALSPADLRALRAAAAPLLAELASRRLGSHAGEDTQ